MCEDLEITFGKSVLIEKCQNDVISFGTSILCDETIPKNHLHCMVSGSGWLIVIRYLDGVALCGQDYSAFRIIMLKKVTKTSFNSKELQTFFTEKVLSYPGTKQSYSVIDSGVKIIDSSIIVCHKKGLSQLLKSTFIQMRREARKKKQQDEYIYFKFGFEKKISFTQKGLPPCVRSIIENNGAVFYGNKEKIKTHFINMITVQELKKQVKFWLTNQGKITDKLSTSIFIRPI